MEMPPASNACRHFRRLPVLADSIVNWPSWVDIASEDELQRAPRKYASNEASVPEPTSRRQMYTLLSDVLLRPVIWFQVRRFAPLLLLALRKMEATCSLLSDGAHAGLSFPVEEQPATVPSVRCSATCSA